MLPLSLLYPCCVCWCVWKRAFVPCPWHKVPWIIPHVQSIVRHVIRLKWSSFLSASTSMGIISLKCPPSHQGDVIMINCGGDGGTWATDSGVFQLGAVCWAHGAPIKMKELSKFHCYGNRFQSDVRSHRVVMKIAVRADNQLKHWLHWSSQSAGLLLIWLR